MKCQCPDVGVLHDHIASLYHPVKELPFVKHEPNECKCTNDLKKFKRGNKVLILCSCCWSSGDIEVK